MPKAEENVRGLPSLELRRERVFPWDRIRGRLSNTTSTEARSQDGCITENSRQPESGFYHEVISFLLMESFKCSSTAQGRKVNTVRLLLPSPAFRLALHVHAPEGRGCCFSRWAPPTDTSWTTSESCSEQSQQAVFRGRGETPAPLMMYNVPLLRRQKAEIYLEGSWEFDFPGKTWPTFLLYCGSVLDHVRLFLSHFSF